MEGAVGGDAKVLGHMRHERLQRREPILVAQSGQLRTVGSCSALTRHHSPNATNKFSSVAAYGLYGSNSQDLY